MKSKKFFFYLFTAVTLLFSHVGGAQNVVFANGVGGAQFDQAMGVAIDGAGNVITTGYFSGIADFNSSVSDSNITSQGSNDIFVVKNDSAGNFMWAFGLGGALDEFNYSSPVTDAAGNIYICGVYSDTVDFDPSVNGIYKLTAVGQYDGFIAKYNSNGGFVWAKSFGGLFNDDVYYLYSAANGDVLFAGSFDTSADLNPDTAAVTTYNSIGGADIFFGRIKSSGILTWLHAIGGTDYDHANSITENYLNQVVLQGSFNAYIDADPNVGIHIIYGTNSPGFIAQYSAGGNFLWANGFNALTPFSCTTDLAGNIYTCGYINGNTDLDPGPDTNKIFLLGSFDGYVAKYDINGNYINAFGIGSNNFDVAYGISLINNNQLVVGGYFNNSADFNPAAGVTNALTSYGMSDVFVAQYDTTLNYIDAFKAGSADFDFCRNIAVGADQSLVIAGGFSATADFDPGAAMLALTSAGSRDGYTVKYGNLPTPVKHITGPVNGFAVYPNPATDYIFIESDMNLTGKSLGIYSTEGRLVAKTKMHEPVLNKISVADLQSGMYFLIPENQKDIMPVKFFKY